jgi:5'-nucleotidase
MRQVLLTNDDGIHAPGLKALRDALAAEFEVQVVAPETEMSAVGHAITLTMPLRVEEVFHDGAFFGYAVRGTPADCVKIAVQELLRVKPDVIVSGINLGANVGVNLLYSGTVSAATEGAFLGFPSAAVSLNTRTSPDFAFAAAFSTQIVRYLLERPVRRGIALNVNIPSVSPERIRGVRFTRQGLSRLEERFERRTDPRGNVYYWLTGEKVVENGRPDTDSQALSEDNITITPIHFDLTCMEELERLQRDASPLWRNGKGPGFP